MQGPVAQWLEPTAHNGLVGGSSPPGPTTQFPKSLITETLREKAALARPGRRTIFDIWSLAGGTCRIRGLVSGQKSSGPGATPETSYGARPSLSYWRAHSAGKSCTVATPMPRGSRPSTAAWTSLGATKARVIVRLTCLILHFSRSAICPTFVTVPAINSSSQCRPFAIAVTSLARVSARIGRGSG